MSSFQKIHHLGIRPVNLGAQTVLLHFEGRVSEPLYEFDNDVLKTLFRRGYMLMSMDMFIVQYLL